MAPVEVGGRVGLTVLTVLVADSLGRKMGGVLADPVAAADFPPVAAAVVKAVMMPSASATLAAAGCGLATNQTRTA